MNYPFWDIPILGSGWVIGIIAIFHVMISQFAVGGGFYLPLADVDQQWLEHAIGSSFCEWKGPAQYWTLTDGQHRLERVGWSYPHPLAGAELLRDRIAFYAHSLDCTVGGESVRPQPGGFYGGWITPELVGPFKGDPGSASW